MCHSSSFPVRHFQRCGVFRGVFMIFLWLFVTYTNKPMAFLQVSFKNCPATTPELEDFGMSMGDWGVCLRSLLGVFGFFWSTPSSMKNLFLLVKLHCIYGIYGISPSVYLFLCRWFGQYSFVLTFVRSFLRSFLPSFVLCDCRCWFFLMFFLLLTHSLTYPLRFTHH